MGEYEPTVFVVDNDKEVCKSMWLVQLKLKRG